MVHSDPKSYAEWYGIAENDPYQGEYETVLGDFCVIDDDDNCLSPSALLENIVEADDEAQAFLIFVRDDDSDNVWSTVLHRLKRFPKSRLKPHPMAGTVFATKGDVVVQQGTAAVVETVQLPPEFLKVTKEVVIPTMATMSSALNSSSENEDSITPYLVGEISVRVRRAVQLPAKYVPLLLGQKYKAVQVWQILYKALEKDGALAEYRPLLDFCSVACTAEGEAAVAHEVLVGAPSDVCQQRQEYLRQDLPALFVTQAATEEQNVSAESGFTEGASSVVTENQRRSSRKRRATAKAAAAVSQGKRSRTAASLRTTKKRATKARDTAKASGRAASSRRTTKKRVTKVRRTAKPPRTRAASSLTTTKPMGKNEQNWLAKLERLKKYKEQHGNIFVPLTYPADPSLARWVIRQRDRLKQIAQGGETTMTGEQFEVLKEIGLANERGPVELPRKRMLARTAAQQESQSGSHTVANGGTPAASGLGVAACNNSTNDVSTNGNDSNPSSDLLQDSVRDVSTSGGDSVAREQTNEGTGKNRKRWLEKLERLRIYKEQHGNVFVPQKYPPDPSLGTWVNTQRMRLKRHVQGKSSTMTTEQFERLKLIGLADETGPVTWPGRTNPPSLKGTSNEARHSTMQTTNTTSGDRTNTASVSGNGAHMPFQLVPPAAVQGPPQDGTTEAVATNASAAIVRGAVVEQPREEQGKNEKKWFAKLERLRLYKEQHGNVFVPIKYDADPALARFAQTQRARLKKMASGEETTITPQQLEALKSVGLGDETGPAERPRKPSAGRVRNRKEKTGGAEAVNQEWLELFGRLKAFKEEHGHPCVPLGYEDHALAKFVRDQRRRLKRLQAGKNKGSGRLSQEHVDMLKDVGLEHGSHIRLWEEQYQKLVAFKLLHGHCDVVLKRHDKSHKVLAEWVRRQRCLFKKRERGQHSTMTDDRFMKLAKLGFTFGKMVDWETRFNQLVDYKARYGNTRVPVGYSGHNKLGMWVKSIRNKYSELQRGGSGRGLDEAKIARLNSIGFDWEIRRRGVAGRAGADDMLGMMPK